MTGKQYKIIKEGISDGTYKRIRLVRIKENEEREMMTTFNSFIKGGEENTVRRLEYIRHQLDKVLPAGNYVIEAATTPTGNGGIVDSFYIKKLPLTIPIPLAAGSGVEQRIEDHTNNQEQMADFDLDDYKDLLTEMSNLKVTVEVQKLQIQTLKAELAQKALNDSAPSGVGGSIMKAVEDHLPTAMSIFDKFLTQRDRGMDLKDRELALEENGHRKKRKVVSNQKKSREDVLQEMEALADSDETAFNATLDEMEIKDPALYDFICEKMQLDTEEEEEQE